MDQSRLLPPFTRAPRPTGRRSASLAGAWTVPPSPCRAPSRGRSGLGRRGRTPPSLPSALTIARSLGVRAENFQLGIREKGPVWCNGGHRALPGSGKSGCAREKSVFFGAKIHQRKLGWAKSLERKRTWVKAREAGLGLGTRTASPRVPEVSVAPLDGPRRLRGRGPWTRSVQTRTTSLARPRRTGHRQARQRACHGSRALCPRLVQTRLTFPDGG